jgi:hypothetical protein
MIARMMLAALGLLLGTQISLAADTLPTKVGQCSQTRIKQIGTRLDGIADSGDAVTYTNGGYQVAYGTIDGLKGAKPGDDVKLCLTEIPDDCPPGDDRGKSYKATDLRTHRSWEAMNSEHMCGGA